MARQTIWAGRPGSGNRPIGLRS